MKIDMKRKLKSTAALIIAAVMAVMQPVSASASSSIPYGMAYASFSLSELSLTAEADGTLGKNYIDVRIDGSSRITVNAVSTGRWLRVGRGSAIYDETSLSRSGRIYVAAGKNEGQSDREGTIVFTLDNGTSQTVTVTQKGQQSSPAAQAELSVDMTELTAEANGTLSRNYVEVNTNNTGGFEARVSSTGNWLKVGRSVASSTNASFNGSGRVYVSVTENNESNDRTGTITITHVLSGESRTVTVTQKGAQSELEVTPGELTAKADGTLSGNYIEVDTKGTGGVSAEVSCDGDWLKIGRSTAASTSVSLSRSGRIYVAARKNTTENDRTGTITITHSDNVTVKTVTVTQEAAKSNLTVSTEQLTAEAGGLMETSYLDVDTAGTGGFEAQVSNGSSWLKIGRRRGDSGRVSYNESGRLYVAVDKNTQSEERTGTITITHENGSLVKTINVTQKALREVLNVDQTSLSADAGGEMAVSFIQVDTDGTGGFRAQVSGTGSWLKIGKNLGDSSRSVSFTESGRIYVSAEKNTETNTRKAVITITHENGNVKKTVEVQQSRVEDSISASPSELVANAAGKISSNSVKVSTNKTGGCRVTAEESWIKIGKSSSAVSSRTLTLSDGSTFYVAADKNVGSARTGKITITHQNGSAKTEVVVKQDGLSAALTVDGSSKTANKDGSFANKTVSVKTGNTGGFTVTVADSSWLKISKDERGSFASGYSELSFDKDAKFYLFASENTGDERSTEITVKHEDGKLERTIKVKQVGIGDAYLSIYTERADFYEPDAGTSGKISVGANEDMRWEARAGEDWIHISESASGFSRNSSLEKTGSGEFYIYVDRNDSLNERSGTVIVSAGTQGIDDHVITVTQAAKERDLHELLENTTIRLTRRTFDKGLTSQILFTYPEGLYQSDIRNVKFASDKKRVAVVDQNGRIRPKKKGTANIYARIYLHDGYSKKFKVKVKVGKRKVTTVNKTK